MAWNIRNYRYVGDVSVVQVPRWRRNPWCCAALHSSANNLHVAFISYWLDKPWFLTEGKLAAVRITPSSWGSQRTCVLHAIKQLLLEPLPGRSRHDARGVSHIQSLYFVFVLLYFILFSALFAFSIIKNTKKLVTCITLFTVLFAFSILKTQKN